MAMTTGDDINKVLKAGRSNKPVPPVSTPSSSKSITLKPIKYNESFEEQKPTVVTSDSSNAQTDSTPSSADTVPVPVIDLNKERESMLADAKQDIQTQVKALRDQNIQDMQSELEQLRADAKQQGYNEGKAEIENEMAAKANELVAKINELGAIKKDDLKKLEGFAIDLSKTMAEKIIQRQISLSDDVFTQVFKQAFDKITDKDEVIIQLNPNDLEAFNAYKDAFEDRFKDIRRLEVIEDSNIQAGGCSIETKLGYIDAKISTKLELLMKALLDFQEREFQRREKPGPEASAPLGNAATQAQPESPDSHDSTDDDLDLDEEESDALGLNAGDDALDDDDDDDDDEFDDFDLDDDDDDDLEDFDDDDDDDGAYEDDFDFEDYDDDFD